MTAEDARNEAYAIAHNMALYYLRQKNSKEEIIDDLEETIRLLAEIISKLKVSIAEDFADKIFSDPEELEILKSLAKR